MEAKVANGDNDLAKNHSGKMFVTFVSNLSFSIISESNHSNRLSNVLLRCSESIIFFRFILQNAVFSLYCSDITMIFGHYLAQVFAKRRR